MALFKDPLIRVPSTCNTFTSVRLQILGLNILMFSASKASEEVDAPTTLVV